MHLGLSVVDKCRRNPRIWAADLSMPSRCQSRYKQRPWLGVIEFQRSPARFIMQCGSRVWPKAPAALGLSVTGLQNACTRFAEDSHKARQSRAEPQSAESIGRRSQTQSKLDFCTCAAFQVDVRSEACGRRKAAASVGKV